MATCNLRGNNAVALDEDLTRQHTRRSLGTTPAEGKHPRHANDETGYAPAATKHVPATNATLLVVVSNMMNPVLVIQRQVNVTQALRLRRSEMNAKEVKVTRPKT